MVRRDGLAAHPAVQERLERAVARDRLHSCLLFHGPPGSGREDTARWLAARLLCTEVPAACGTCPVCRRIERDLHPDVLVRRPGSRSHRMVIDDVRSLQGELGYRPFEGGRRVLVLLEAERMTTQAANAFLKTLEEPPRHTVLVLAAPSPDALLPTVRSRCQPLGFSLLSPERQAVRLASARELDPDLCRRALESLGGDPSPLRIQDPEEVLEERDRLVRLAGGWPRRPGRSEEILRWVEERASSPRRDDEGELEEPDRLHLGLILLRTLGRDLLRLASGSSVGQDAPGGSGRLAHEEARAELESLARALGARGAARWIDRVEEARRGLDRGANRRLAGEDLLLDLQELLAGAPTP